MAKLSPEEFLVTRTHVNGVNKSGLVQWFTLFLDYQITISYVFAFV